MAGRTAARLRVADRLEFTLKDLGYEFPKYAVPRGETMDSFLRKVTMAGARARYSHLGGKVLKQLNRELDLIEKLGFAGYFLIVWDITNFCTDQNILVQGRGTCSSFTTSPWPPSIAKTGRYTGDTPRNTPGGSSDSSVVLRSILRAKATRGRKEGKTLRVEVLVRRKITPGPVLAAWRADLSTDAV